MLIYIYIYITIPITTFLSFINLNNTNKLIIIQNKAIRNIFNISNRCKID